MIQALAGDEHWRNIRYLRFDFSFEKASQRTMWNQHLWDRVSGDNRIEWRGGSSNAQVVVLFNMNTKKGRAWVGEFEKTGDDKDALIAEAQRRHINDVFWLGAPFMLADNRASLKYEGTMTVDGQDYDLIHAQFRRRRLAAGRPLLVLHQPGHALGGPLGLLLEKFQWNALSPRRLGVALAKLAERRQRIDRFDRTRAHGSRLESDLSGGVRARRRRCAAKACSRT